MIFSSLSSLSLLLHPSLLKKKKWATAEGPEMLKPFTMSYKRAAKTLTHSSTCSLILRTRYSPLMLGTKHSPLMLGVRHSLLVLQARHSLSICLTRVLGINIILSL